MAVEVSGFDSWGGSVFSFNCFRKDTEMGKLVLRRKPGESIEIYDPTNEAMGVIVITQRAVGSGRSQIEIDAPNRLVIKRSELAGKGGAK